MAALALVTATVALACYLAWTLLAGQQLVLATKSSTTSQVTGIEDARDGQSSYSAPQLEDPAANVRSLSPSGAGSSARSGGASPTTINGTTLAATMSVLAVAIGVLIQRSILRRLRQPREDDAAEESRPVREVVDLVGGEHAEQIHDLEAARHLAVGTGDDDLHGALNSGAAAAVVQPRRELPPPGDADQMRSGMLSGMLPGQVPQALAPLVPATGTTAPADQRAVLYDRRAQRRVKFHGRARLQWPGHDLACRTQSLDVRGMRCLIPATDLDTPPPIGAPARITITLNGTLVPIGATVAWSRGNRDGYRVGLHFDVLDDVQHALLLAFVEEAEDEA